MHSAGATIIEKCLSLADSASRRSWTFHNTTEALFWFRSALKLDPNNTAARLGAAQAFQYVASQPWWHNDVGTAKRAAVQALAMVETLPTPCNAVESRKRVLICGQIYSAIGRIELANRHLNQGIAIDPEYSAGHYFVKFNQLFLDPRDDRVLPGLQKAVEMAKREGNDRRLGASLYFKGFANTLFGNYRDAINDLRWSLEINPRYGSAGLALIAATALSRHRHAYKTVRHFRERNPNFKRDVLNYMWLERSASDKYLRLANPMMDTIVARLDS
jgi:tetratricopeptide (TPR) repeat protein